MVLVVKLIKQLIYLPIECLLHLYGIIRNLYGIIRNYYFAI